MASPVADSKRAIARAMQLLAEANDLLDATSVSPDVTAHVELALIALRDMLEEFRGPTT